MGFGPMTGRAAGYCAGYPVQGYMNPIPGRGSGFGWGRGRGFGRGRGRGMGWGRWAWGFAPGVPLGYPGAAYAPGPQEERTVLENQMQALQGQLDAVKQRIDELAAEEAEKK